MTSGIAVRTGVRWSLRPVATGRSAIQAKVHGKRSKMRYAMPGTPYVGMSHVGCEPKSDHRTFVHYGTCCEILPIPPLIKEGTQGPPFAKGAARSAGGFLSGTVPISGGSI